ncbi:MAG: hypothetical protein A3G24_06260 [Betaproteobacteria bacterium RIFCSPLOWO2_12_FULL_62_13]|nr:MAG: hypothetical protein A3G24_06260 [Betaproteobacteria bacterium RIFCSPLOWO2_12_FULL_62_13]
MSITLRDALARLTVPELKDLARHLPGAETAGLKGEVIERIVVAMTDDPGSTRSGQPGCRKEPLLSWLE